MPKQVKAAKTGIAMTRGGLGDRQTQKGGARAIGGAPKVPTKGGHRGLPRVPKS